MSVTRPHRVGWLWHPGRRHSSGGRACSLQNCSDDHGTTRLILGAYGLATVLPLLLRPLRIRQMPPSAGPQRLAIEASGLGMEL